MIGKRADTRLRRRLCLLIITAGLVLPGCATFIDSHVADKDEKGFVYYLPMPVIVVTPQTDGTATVELEYLPDESKAYTLQAHSLVSNYTLDVQTENGLLKTVSLDADSAQTVKAAVDAASTIADKAYTAKQAERDKEKADRVAREEKVRELRQAVAVAQQELAALELLSKDTANGVTPAQLTAAKLAVIKSETVLAVFLNEDVADVAGVDDGGAAYDIVTAQAETAPGPVLFQVQMGRDHRDYPTITLRAMAAQRDFDTATIGAPKPDTTPTVPKPLRLGVTTVSRESGNATDQTEIFNTPISIGADFLEESLLTHGPINVATSRCQGRTQTLESAKFGVQPGAEKNQLVISFPPETDLPDGEYCISAIVTGKGLEAPTSVDLLYLLARSQPGR